MTEPPEPTPADPPEPAPAPKPKAPKKDEPPAPTGDKGILDQLAELPKLIRSEIDSALDERMRVNEPAPEPKGEPAPEPKGEPAKDEPPHKKSLAERMGF